MSTLPTEVLQTICEYAGERVVGWPAPTTTELDASRHNPPELHFSSLLAFSRSSRHFRHVSVPYLFRRLRVRTVEEATLVSKSSLLSYARHLNLPAINILTARRPIPPNLSALVANIKSIRIASTTPSFYYTACTPLARLLNSARALDTLELDCDPVLESMDTTPILARLIPALPSSLIALRVSIPGGQPEATGVEVRKVLFRDLTLGLIRCTIAIVQTLLNALAHHPLPKLNSICLSMHMVPGLAAKPERLAIAIARRLSSLRFITFVAPGRNPQRGTPLWDLVSPQTGLEAYGGFRQPVMGWEFCRDVGEDARGTIEPGYAVNTEGPYWEDARMFD